MILANPERIAVHLGGDSAAKAGAGFKPCAHAGTHLAAEGGTLLPSLSHDDRLTVLGGTAVGRALGLPGSRRPSVMMLRPSQDGQGPPSRAAAPRPPPGAPSPPARRSRRLPAGAARGPGATPVRPRRRPASRPRR